MKKLMIAACLMVTTACLADFSWYTVSTNDDGSAKSKWLTVQAVPKTLGDNEYPSTYSFPTNDIIYWKKVGNDWVGMTTNEQAVVNDKLKQNTTTEAVSDVDFDAIFALIAHMSTVKDKDYDYVTNAFKNAVSPDKANKKQKTSSNK